LLTAHEHAIDTGPMNGALFDAINDLAGHSTAADDLMKAAARYLVFAMAAAVAIYWVMGRGRQRAVNQEMVVGAVVAALLGLATASLIQHFYVHPRPFVDRQDVILLINHGADASLPSEHAVAAFSLAGAAVWSRRLLLGAVLLLAAVALGFARIYTGLHYPADVAVAAGVGLLASFIVVRLAGPLIMQLRAAIVRALPPAIRTVLLLD
jgi:undecaprenyl-diphosphatase